MRHSLLSRLRPRGLGPAAMLLALVGCVPGQHIDVPGEGALRVATDKVRVSVRVPASVREQTRQLDAGLYYFATERSEDHTVVAMLDARNVVPGGRSPFPRDVAGRSDQEVLAAYLSFVEPLERLSPGRPGNVLRSYEHAGATRPAQAAQGALCDERAFVAEDRQVPGHGGAPFLFHGRFYVCIDPRSHLPVELSWSERYPVDGERLSPTYAAEASAYFDSLRFE